MSSPNKYYIIDQGSQEPPFSCVLAENNHGVSSPIISTYSNVFIRYVCLSGKIEESHPIDIPLM